MKITQINKTNQSILVIDNQFTDMSQQPLPIDSPINSLQGNVYFMGSFSKDLITTIF
jgi:DNA-binding transcriptional MocR family regulator